MQPQRAKKKNNVAFNLAHKSRPKSFVGIFVVFSCGVFFRIFRFARTKKAGGEWGWGEWSRSRGRSTLYAPFSVRLPMLNAAPESHPETTRNHQLPTHCPPPTAPFFLWRGCPCCCFCCYWCCCCRCCSLWTRKRNVSHKMLSQRFTTRLLRITRHPLLPTNQQSSTPVFSSPSLGDPLTPPMASSNLFYDNIRAFSAEI